MLNASKKKTARTSDYATADVKASLTRNTIKPKPGTINALINSLPVIRSKVGNRSQTIVRNRFGSKHRKLKEEENPFTTTNQHHYEEL